MTIWRLILLCIIDILLTNGFINKISHKSTVISEFEPCCNIRRLGGVAVGATFRKSNFARSRNRQEKEKRKERNEGVDFEMGVGIKEKERLQKVMARAGVASRRGAESIIEEGRVTVNDKTVTVIGTKVSAKDVIVVDGTRIKLPDASEKLWVVLHKPKQVTVTTKDQKGRDTVLDLVPQAKDFNLLPVGQMGRSCSGLLILTNDNGWIHPLTHPSFEHQQRYELVLRGIPTEAALQTLSEGASVPRTETCGGGVLQACTARVLKVDAREGLTVLDVRVSENRLDLFDAIALALQCECVSSRRLEFGPLKLKGLRKGEWRELTPLEEASLKKACKEVHRRDTGRRRPETVDEAAARRREVRYHPEGAARGRSGRGGRGQGRGRGRGAGGGGHHFRGMA